MSPQADYVVSNGTGAAVRSDINGQLAAIVSNNSGASAPATTYAYMLWADTSTNLLKLRNGANSAWITVGDLTAANLGLATLASPTFTGTATIPTLTVSTAANIPLGSAASPTLYFTGDSNTGLYSPGADQVALSTGGTGRLFIDSSGRCGIGTSSPVFQTQIAGTGAVTDGDSKGIVFGLYNSSTAAAGLGSSIAFGANISTTGTNAVGNLASIEGIKENATTDNFAGALKFVTRVHNGSPTERVRITSTGNVGIGTTPSGTYKLDVDGYGRFGSTSSGNYGSVVLSTTGVAEAGWLSVGSFNWHGGSDFAIGAAASKALLFGSNNAERARIDTSGRLLVGTSSYSGVHKLVVQGRTDSSTGNAGIILQRGSLPSAANQGIGIIQFEDNNANAGAYVLAQSDAAWTGGTSQPTRLEFHTCASGASSPTERMRIDNAGRVQIGTTGLVSSEQLAVTKGSGTALTLNVYNSAATSTNKNANPIARFATQGSGADCCLQVTDSQSHNYYFGGNNGGAYVVTNSNGVRLSSGGTSWAADSDERVKDIIEPITDGLDKVSTLRAVIGKYKTDDKDKRRSFLIAQDVQAVLPEAVYDEQGTLMLAYTDTIPLLVAALKESKERIEQLEAKVAALESA